MAVALEAFSVVVRRGGIEKLGGLKAFQELVPNSTFCHDDNLARCAFMDRGDAVEFIDMLHLRGLETNAADTDVVLVTAFDGTMNPQCAWLQVSAYKKGWIGWLMGTTPTTISAPSTWDPELESNLERMTTEEAARRLKFLRREENVEVFIDRDTGRELYVGRTGLPLDRMYEEAKDFVMSHLRDPGGPSVEPSLETEFRRVIQMLQILSERREGSWTVQWLLGKAWHALGDAQRAASALERANEIEPGHDAVARELAGVYLELGRADEAVSLAEAAVSTEPQNADLLANLALAYLIANRPEAARKTIDAAIQIAADDPVSQAVRRVIAEVQDGSRPTPQNLMDIQTAPPKGNPTWGQWVKRLLQRFQR